MVDNIGNNNSSDREGFKYNFTGGGSVSSDYHHHLHHQEGVIKEPDRLLPIANVGRIMKQNLPPNAKISKEAKETMQESSDKCHKEKRKTVNGDDICWALATLGFDDYAEPLKRYLHRYRELEGEKAANQGKANSNEEQTATKDKISYSSSKYL
ncbi:nuclear transcription factor Y subunit B-5-like [Pyrus ussuriensis x Pyrus communis]|uniref:Nuclear transcription factor Y subunit B-5-like n=1 Tax=Pyrus ussuriensis x Pyrus communis TaxID=2448454 RepID=A0A5N5FUW5_9ROSA|nr:nuclear transcription factor Y subunit B-5-like [Pyrus ussuriensis x Pyrus communis]